MGRPRAVMNHACFDDNLITEVWHIEHFWVSYGRCAMPVLPVG